MASIKKIKLIDGTTYDIYDARIEGLDSSVGTSTTNVPTSNAVKSYIDTKLNELSGAMVFIGTSTTAITDGGTQNPTVNGSVIVNKTAGNVVIYGSQEYVWNGSSWELFGDEGSYALKTITVTGNNGLTGGGALTENRTISHAVPSGAAAGTLGSSTERTYIKTVTTDAYGHITAVTTGTETVTLPTILTQVDNSSNLVTSGAIKTYVDNKVIDAQQIWYGTTPPPANSNYIVWINPDDINGAISSQLEWGTY